MRHQVNHSYKNSSSYAEVNFDGLVGPTHNYGGLALGNKASIHFKDQLSNPKAAALQGLDKMRFLIEKGLVQGVLPPHERPFNKILDQVFDFNNTPPKGTNTTKDNELLIKNVMSASAMWTANAATVSPSLDTSDKRVHFTTANLNSSFHRAIEADQTTRVLSEIFSDSECFKVHPAVHYFGDEGAANHGRICEKHGTPGVEIFVYGRSAFDKDNKIFPRRQTLEASMSIARKHGLSSEKFLLLEQSQTAIDAGVFHNDVISVMNENVFLLHEKTFENQSDALSEISEKCEFDIIFIQISEQELSLKEAISSYLFNSQLITLADGSMALILPREVENSHNASSCVYKIIEDDSNPIQHSFYIDLKQSMRNGGGPACLRLRVLMNKSEINALKGNVILDHKLIKELEKIIKHYYRDQLHPSNLTDRTFIKDSLNAINEISNCLSLTGIYDFQH